MRWEGGFGGCWGGRGDSMGVGRGGFGGELFHLSGVSCIAGSALHVEMGRQRRGGSGSAGAARRVAGCTQWALKFGLMQSGEKVLNMAQDEN